jgi:hypothetical protein
MTVAEDTGTDASEERTGLRLVDHPRARASIARAKGWGAIAGFAIAGWYGYRMGNPFVDVVIRCILVGALTSLAVWGVAQAIWKQIVFAELAAKRKEAVEKQKAILDELEDPEHLQQ